ncbi:MAG TPA: M1 family aminopeptidase [Usitatibacter sp.]|nr:M1 family aminopeptidase [Usitatibacter sp.]
MGALASIAGFEFRQRFKRISTHVYFLVFAALAALWMAAAGGAFASANIVFGADKVNINSPYALSQTIGILGFFAVTVIAAVMGRAVQQDFEYQSFHFFFTSPIHKRDYYLGRFVGAFLVLVYVVLGIAFGVLVGVHWPGVDASRVGPWSLRAFAQPYLVVLLPNVLILGGAFFGLAALTRRMLPVYVGSVIVLIGYLTALRLIADIDNRTIAALLDPVGQVATGLVARYWTVADRNTRFVPLAGDLLMNRAVWLAVGLAIFGFCYWRFSMSQAMEGKRAKRDAAANAVATQRVREVAIPASRLDLTTGAYLRELPAIVLLHVRETVKNVYFMVIVLAGALFVLSNSKVVGSMFGTNTYPVTYQVLDFVSGTFALFMLVVTAFYAGELVWRERDARVAQLTDSLPAPTWLEFAAKLMALFAIQALLQVVVMACGLLVQVINGYTHFEIDQYLYRLFAMQLPEYWMVAALAFFIHVAVNQKYLGHFLVVLYYIVVSTAAGFGFDHNLYLYGSVPTVIYSDMNRYGHFLPAVRWFQAYWGAWAILLLAAARVLWVRGVDTQWRVRLRGAVSRASHLSTAVAAIAVVAIFALGAFIFYNTNVLNPYRTQFAQQELQAQYEKSYKALENMPQPKIVTTTVAVDIFPHEHRVRFSGRYKLVNKTPSPIREVYVNVQEQAHIAKLASSIAWKEVESRPELAWHRFALDKPLEAGAAMTLDFDVDYAARGFTNGGADPTVVDNGTFVNNILMPRIGYIDFFELQQDRDRAKHGLKPRLRMPDLDDAAARNRNYISSDGDWIDFDTTVSTDADQVALAPGYLQKEWTEGGRRHFHYVMDRPILNFYAFLSARYSVKKDVWHPGAENVPIEIYYQPGHEYDLQRMVDGVKDSLDYYTKNFSPYQHHQVRILEFPRYQAFAQSFPNTIPFSEGIGFIAKVDDKDPKDLDYPYYVTAHEVGHQWWAHQAIGADVQGVTMLSETLAQYSALMVMKHKYGDAKMKRFLRYELDNYLRSRGAERQRELPLYRNENQPYIHYRKGSLAMYEFQDAIGEENVNRALASFLKKVAFQEPPYTTSRELLAEFRAVTPPDYQYLITDLFETITLFENRAVEASAKDAGNGMWDVTLKVSAKKLRADETGVQNEVPMDDWVDIGVLDADDNPLSLERRKVKSGESTYAIRVKGKPAKAGIDPINKLIDRRPEDNVTTVKY